MARPRKHGEKLESIPIPLSWESIDLICGPASKQPFGFPWRKQIAAAALAGAKALKLDRVLGAEGVALVDNPEGWRLVVQGSPQQLPVLREALVWFEDFFIKSKRGDNMANDNVTRIPSRYLNTEISEGFFRDIENMRNFHVARGETSTVFQTRDGRAIKLEFIPDDPEEVVAK